jgi:primase-polymerase (primpol)-like protein
VRGTLPPGGNRRGPVEMYAAGRFLTITGERFADAPSVVAADQAGIEAVHARFIGAAAAAGSTPRAQRVAAAAAPVPAVPRPTPTTDDAALLARMFASAAGTASGACTMATRARTTATRRPPTSPSQPLALLDGR